MSVTGATPDITPSDPTRERYVFFISDRTGITAETIGHTLITQFPSIQFRQKILPFVNTQEKTEAAVKQINKVAATHPNPPLIFNTLLDEQLKSIMASASGCHFDFFDMFLIPLEEELGVPSSHKSGLSHGMNDEEHYMARMDAVNFALTNDDGTNVKKYRQADIILIGASRSGKTPTSLYLALQHGVNAANYPLTDADLDSDRLPSILRPYREKILGLTINAERLANIREKRRPGSRYASLQQCQKEINVIEEIYAHERLPVIDASHMSIEEITTTIMQQMRPLFDR